MYDYSPTPITITILQVPMARSQKFESIEYQNMGQTKKFDKNVRRVITNSILYKNQ